MFRENLCLSCSNSLDVLIGAKLKKERAQLLVNAKKIIKKPEYDLEEDDQEVLKDQNYVEVLGQDIQGIWRGIEEECTRIFLLVAKIALQDA